MNPEITTEVITKMITLETIEIVTIWTTMIDLMIIMIRDIVAEVAAQGNRMIDLVLTIDVIIHMIEDPALEILARPPVTEAVYLEVIQLDIDIENPGIMLDHYTPHEVAIANDTRILLEDTHQEADINMRAAVVMIIEIGQPLEIGIVVTANMIADTDLHLDLDTIHDTALGTAIGIRQLANDYLG